MSVEADFKVKCPDMASILKGKKYFVHAKIGGESQIIDVVALGTPYSADFGKGRKAHYVDVFGYGWSGSVLTSKLRVAVVVKDKKDETCWHANRQKENLLFAED